MLRITKRQCDHRGIQTIQVESRPNRSATYTSVINRTQILSNAPRGSGSLEDIDGDGMLEFIETEHCGAGPNCFRRVFKIDPHTNRTFLFFEGGFSSFERISDFYVSTSRSNAATWVHQIYAIPGKGQPIDQQNVLYSITVSKQSVDAPANCRAQQPKGSGWATIELKQKSLMALCEVLGDNVVLERP